MAFDSSTGVQMLTETDRHIGITNNTGTTYTAFDWTTQDINMAADENNTVSSTNTVLKKNIGKT